MQYQATLYQHRVVGEPRVKIASWRVNAEKLEEAVAFAIKPIKNSSTKGPDIIWPNTGEFDIVPVLP